MEDLEAKIGAIMNDPGMMEKLMSMAQSLSEPKQEQPQESMPDLKMVQKLAGLAGQANIDKDQQCLLSALSPYLSSYRLDKLRKAMRAARMARLASGLFGR